MKLLAPGDKTTSKLVRLIQSSQHVQFSMAWATVNNPVYKAIIANREKLHNATLGICGTATDPKCLIDFTDSPNLRFAVQNNGIFHPKVYLFETSDTWDVVMGSANMTTGGLKHNREVMVHLSGKSSDNAFLQDMKSRLNGYYADAVIMDKTRAGKYAAHHKLFKIKHSLSVTSPDTNLSKHPIDSSVMSMGWDEFVARVKKDPYHRYKERLELLKQIRGLFKEHPRFRDMNLSARKVIAGLPHDDYPNSGWFGVVRGGSGV